jgi:hypothetical protein
MRSARTPMAGAPGGAQSGGMNQQIPPHHDPLRNDPPGLGPAPVRHDIGDMRSVTWQPSPRRRSRWPLWAGGAVALAVIGAVMFVEPDQWTSAHLDRPAPVAETVPTPEPPQTVAQADTAVPLTPADSVAAEQATSPPVDSSTARDTAPARSAPKVQRSEPSTSEGALQPTPQTAPVEPVAAAPVPTPSPTPAEPVPVPLDPPSLPPTPAPTGP